MLTCSGKFVEMTGHQVQRVMSAFHSRRTVFAFIFVAISSYIAAQQPPLTRTPAPIIRGSFQLPEISAAGVIDNRLLVAADDPEKKHGYHMIDCLADPLSRLAAGGSIGATSEEQIYRDILLLLHGPSAGEPDPDRINDLEDMAVAPTGNVYFITSHSLNKKKKAMPERRQLLRVRFDSGSAKPVDAATSSVPIIPRLPRKLQKAATSRPDERKHGHYRPGLNIEGLAWAPENDLLIGLRSPLIESKAVVLRIKNVDATFDQPTAPAATAPITIEATLNLEGMGIRGMCYDEKEKGYWIIAGISPDPDVPDNLLPNDWVLWFWDSNHQLHSRLKKSDLAHHMRLPNPEAVCVLRANDVDYLLLISDNDKNKPSSYVLVPRSQLK
jgi:hypothetical protein